MKTLSSPHLRRGLVGLAIVGLVACNGDDDNGEDTGTADTGDDVADIGDTTDVPDTMDAEVGPDVPDTDGGSRGTRFSVTLSNTSDESARPTAFSPGVWAIHTGPNALFELDEADPGVGLEPLAEDGNPTPLAESLEGQMGISAVGSFGSTPLPPGASRSFDIEAEPGDGALSIATMFAQSNDIIAANSAGSIPLFDQDDAPLGMRDVTGQLAFIDAGTERNQAPGLGPTQAPRQPAADRGAREGVVAHLEDGTRTLPIGAGIAEVAVAESNGEFTITIDNVSAARGAITTPISPAFWAVHDETFSFFSPGQPAADGLESLAEDGSPADLLGVHAGAQGVLAAGITDGPANPGGNLTFAVTPDADHPKLNFATMVAESNDAFIAPVGGGIDLLDEQGQPRDTAAIADDFRRRLAVWDGGSEANEVPGVGPNQAPRQSSPDTGPDDPNTDVRLYDDATNDLGGPIEGTFVEVDITHGPGPGQFDVVLENKSDQTVYHASLTPVAWAVHGQGVDFFRSGQPASAGLEGLAEDGDAQGLVDELPDEGVLLSGVASIPDDNGGPGPISPGDSYSFRVTPDQEHPYLSLATMVVPSNDTFLAFNPSSVRLLNASGMRRGESAIETDVRSSLRAWNAGTEANQAGGAGPDQPPRQDGTDTGAPEGDGQVRPLDDPVWTYPTLADTLTVTIEPVD